MLSPKQTARDSPRPPRLNPPVLADTNGGVITVGAATAMAPLFALQGMDLEQLGRVNHVSVSYDDPKFDNARAEHRLTIVRLAPACPCCIAPLVPLFLYPNARSISSCIAPHG